ncbi:MULTISPECIES: hypothetical protein [unclassified Streptomyces]|uniref:hypothetical protein n=1 Tax=unclassified Streptomyces TaxID=2593676 RepID=UPI0011B943CA|nr:MULTISPECIES: hypothetical protein [unclassified Streptomyces]
MLKRPGISAIGALLVVATMSSCQGPGPSSVRFGYRWDGSGNVVIAYPLCPGDKVTGARVTVEQTHGDELDFKTLWSAKKPVSQEVERGVFSVGTSSSFGTEKLRLRTALPQGFYVAAEEETADGDPTSSREDWVDQSMRPKLPLKPGEYITSRGKIVSRQWVNNQLPCNR